ncbi:MAG: HNH endonuclease [Planctomycetes bacterium]|nr:HNH endonuclease [Planctomycetota bacterium]
MDEALRQYVRRRANQCCEYCQLHESHEPFFSFQIEHIITKQHGGSDSKGNLAWACHHCNLHKGPNLSGRDPESRKIVHLFNPRRHKWNRHFYWDGPILVGRTAIGRATIATLGINLSHRVILRETLIVEGVFPIA